MKPIQFSGVERATNQKVLALILQKAGTGYPSVEVNNAIKGFSLDSLATFIVAEIKIACEDEPSTSYKTKSLNVLETAIRDLEAVKKAIEEIKNA